MAFQSVRDAEVAAIRDASRRLVRELGLLGSELAGTPLPISAIHAMIEIGRDGASTAAELAKALRLEKSSVSRMLAKLIDSEEVAVTADPGDGRAKRLSLTARGRETLSRIDGFADARVSDAMAAMSFPARSALVEGLPAYATALAIGSGDGGEVQRHVPFHIHTGYQPGMIGRAVEMHARFYQEAAKFGKAFEAQIAAGLSEFAHRLERPCNQIWTASNDGRIAGIVAIDGEDLQNGAAHLRWFIVDLHGRGSGMGRALLSEALSFCDENGFAEIHLWTFRGLDAARHLYERSGFVLRAEAPGNRWGEEVFEQHFVRRRPVTEP